MKHSAAIAFLAIGALIGAAATGAVGAKVVAGDTHLPIPVDCADNKLPCTSPIPVETGKPGPVVMPGTSGGSIVETKAQGGGFILSLYEKDGQRMQSLHIPKTTTITTCFRQYKATHC